MKWNEETVLLNIYLRIHFYVYGQNTGKLLKNMNFWTNQSEACNTSWRHQWILKTLYDWSVDECGSMYMDYTNFWVNQRPVSGNDVIIRSQNLFINPVRMVYKLKQYYDCNFWPIWGLYLLMTSSDSKMEFIFEIRSP